MRTKSIATVSAVVFGLSAALLGGTALSQTTTPAPAEDPILQQGQTEAPAEIMPEDDATTPGTGMADDADPLAPDTGVAEGDALTPDTGMAADDAMMPRRSVVGSAEPYTGDVLAGITADELIGMNVVDAAGDSVGSVTDLLFGADDRVDHAIVDVGGFLGFGAKSVAIPLDELTIAEGDGEVVVNLTRDELDAMPEWTRGDDGWMSN
jgi:sporulation protein YlmC with PRC-barrel domain